MPTVFSSQPYEYEVEHSRFIGQAFRLATSDALSDYLVDMAQRYPNATHYTWAYRIAPGDERASDNGEPHGTAGHPMLHILTYGGWNETLVIVVRYFGGIKLGRGGLVRAYQKACQLALEHTVKGIVQEVVQGALTVAYQDYQRLMASIANDVITHQISFTDRVQLSLAVESSRWPTVLHKIAQETRGQAIVGPTQTICQLVPAQPHHS